MATGEIPCIVNDAMSALVVVGYGGGQLFSELTRAVVPRNFQIIIFCVAGSRLQRIPWIPWIRRLSLSVVAVVSLGVAFTA